MVQSKHTFLPLIGAAIVGVTLAAFIMLTNGSASTSKQKPKTDKVLKSDRQDRDKKDSPKQENDLEMEKMDNTEAVGTESVLHDLNDAQNPTKNDVNEYEFILNDEFSSHFVFSREQLLCYHHGDALADVPPAPSTNVNDSQDGLIIAPCNVEYSESTSVFVEKESKLDSTSIKHLFNDPITTITTTTQETCLEECKEISIPRDEQKDIIIETTLAPTEIGIYEFTTENSNQCAALESLETTPNNAGNQDNLFEVINVHVRSEIQPLPLQSSNATVQDDTGLKQTTNFNINAPEFVPSNFGFSTSKVSPKRPKQRKKKPRQIRGPHIVQSTLADFISVALSAVEETKAQ